MATTEELITQIERVLRKFPPVAASWHASNVTSGFRDTVGFAALQTECVALGNFIYGADHAQVRSLVSTFQTQTLFHLKSAEGILRGTIESLRHGLLTELRTQVLLDIKSDFVDAALRSLDDGAVEAAAVLASIVLEDSTKRLAERSELDGSENQEFSAVVLGLFKAGAISKATKGVLLGYRDLRNAALHAQWRQVSPETVRSLLLFLPHFMEQHGV